MNGSNVWGSLAPYGDVLPLSSEQGAVSVGVTPRTL